MWHRPRRRVDAIASWQRAREMFASVVAERDTLKRDLEWARRDLAMTEKTLNDCVAALRELRAASQARVEAEQRCAALYRERELPASCPAQSGTAVTMIDDQDQKGAGAARAGEGTGAARARPWSARSPAKRPS
jgi:hypothetical protein